MNKFLSLSVLLIFFNCQHKGSLQLITELPEVLEEVSGVEYVYESGLLWMHNDSGNESEIYGVSTEGELERIVNIKAKNIDWEDITADDNGNLYIADFGNNANKRKNLVVLKVRQHDIANKDNVSVERIEFSYPNQKKFPPKKKQLFFDAESLFYANNSLYIFTKSRVKNKHGVTSLYKIPATKGQHKAKFIGEFNTCDDLECWITAAAISPDGKKIALLNLNSVLLFTNFTGDNFFNGDFKEIPLGFISQKEGLCFKDNNNLYVTDERAQGKGGKLYALSLD